MKYSLFIDKDREEELVLYVHKETELVKDIINLASNEDKSINGVYNDEIKKIIPSEVSCFISEGNKVFALVKDKKYLIKKRLYQLEEIMDDTFIKVNQSCLANRRRILKFKTSIGGTLMVIFDNNYSDYVSRRELKNIKQRMGI